MNRDKFIEKEIKRTEKTWAHHILGLAFIVVLILLYKVEPIVIVIFAIGAVLGMLSGYKYAFGRIKKTKGEKK